jgi:hypothetical protein
MCEPASFVLTREHKCYWSKTTDRHDEIIKEHGLHAFGVRGVNVIGVEINPPNDDFAAPLDQWTYRLDENRTPPDWYNAQKAEAVCREELKEWVKHRVVLTERQVLEGEVVFVGKCGTVSDNSGTVSFNRGTVGDNWGTVSDNSGTVSFNWGTVGFNRGTVGFNRGTVSANWGTVSNNRGTVSDLSGGVVRFFCKFSCKISGLHTVAIDMTGKKAKCYVGTAKPRVIKGGK